MTAGPIDYSDVQGLVRFGYKRMTEASYVLARVKDAAAARSWLGSAPVTNAATQDSPPPTALHVAFTPVGLDRFGVPAAVLAAFSPEFLGGMTEDNRSRRLGDVGSNAPDHWEWGGGAATVPHLLVMFFAEPGGLASFMQRSTGPAWDAGFETVSRLDTADLDGVEPFGFADGISQPEIDWNDSAHAPGSRQRLQQLHRARRVPPRLSKRIRQVHRSSVTRRRRPQRGPADG